MGAKVTVASKLPMKLEMQCCKKRVEQRRHQGELWNEEIFHKAGPMVVIQGTAYPNGDAAAGHAPAAADGGRRLVGTVHIPSTFASLALPRCQLSRKQRPERFFDVSHLSLITTQLPGCRNKDLFGGHYVLKAHP